MNDINNDSSIDLEAKLDTKLAKKIANAKNRRDKRNGDIYKRFLKRVQHPESHKKLEPLNSARHLPTYEPLTDEELQFFASQDKHDTQPTKLPKEATAAAPDTERDNDTLDFTLDFSEPDRTTTTSHSVSTPEGELDTDKGTGSVFSADIVEVDSGVAPKHHIDDHEPQDRQAAASTEIEASSSQHTDSQSIDPQAEQTLASKRKPSTLIIGIGSVLLAAAVLGYAAITYFSNDTKDNPTQSTEATTPDNDNAAATGTVAVATQQEQDAMTDTSATADHTASNDSDAALSSDESDAIATTEQPADESQDNAASTSEDKDLDTELDAEPVITYEEFKDESQTTLYRETND
ncbi:hypothetical protein [Psychrobacter halodurans]|uniref:Uncharacterized protein n=1 Tax=Psychrobacter halodurans TaxID=2818439 RepID=A0AAW4IWR7_9GAMM|nr:hypothetical protein [Psychrobacter halodurans]MBO1517213.1 hypothetical protein [Psychrobacter halodurans]